MSARANLASFLIKGPPPPPPQPPAVQAPPNGVVLHSANWRSFMNNDHILPPIVPLFARPQVQAPAPLPRIPSPTPEPKASLPSGPNMEQVREAAECNICHEVASLPIALCNLCCNCTLCAMCLVAYLESEWRRLKNLPRGEHGQRRLLPTVVCPLCRGMVVVMDIPNVDRRMQTLCEALSETVDPLEARHQMGVLVLAKEAYCDAILTNHFKRTFIPDCLVDPDYVDFE
uniref:RING-type domain-containing protein n=1 Tax=Mycena chlorophos TaxID=658473 RepID=A0ABQ0M4U4_MYCCL|nr:predicted protein [Mycena chlorophos]